jgi:hypothetical protein|nr:MAG TPA: hypothetical protein [Caudoviricetes sp.]
MEKLALVRIYDETQLSGEMTRRYEFIKWDVKQDEVPLFVECSDIIDGKYTMTYDNIVPIDFGHMRHVGFDPLNDEDVAKYVAKYCEFEDFIDSGYYYY